MIILNLLTHGADEEPLIVCTVVAVCPQKVLQSCLGLFFLTGICKLSGLWWEDHFNLIAFLNIFTCMLCINECKTIHLLIFCGHVVICRTVRIRVGKSSATVIFLLRVASCLNICTFAAYVGSCFFSLVIYSRKMYSGMSDGSIFNKCII